MKKNTSDSASSMSGVITSSFVFDIFHFFHSNFSSVWIGTVLSRKTWPIEYQRNQVKRKARLVQRDLEKGLLRYSELFWISSEPWTLFFSGEDSNPRNNGTGFSMSSYNHIWLETWQNESSWLWWMCMRKEGNTISFSFHTTKSKK